LKNSKRDMEETCFIVDKKGKIAETSHNLFHQIDKLLQPKEAVQPLTKDEWKKLVKFLNNQDIKKTLEEIIKSRNYNKEFVLVVEKTIPLR